MKNFKELMHQLREGASEASDLYLYIINDGELYRTYAKKVQSDHLRQAKAGKYNRYAGVNDYKPLMDAGIKKYTNEFGGRGFTKSDYTVITSLVAQYFDAEIGVNKMQKSEAPLDESSNKGKLKKKDLVTMMQRHAKTTPADSGEQDIEDLKKTWSSLGADQSILNLVDRFYGKKMKNESTRSKVLHSTLTFNLKKHYKEVAAEERKAGGEIEINKNEPYIAIKTSKGEEYYFQDHEAQQMLDDAPKGITPEEYYLAQSLDW